MDYSTQIVALLNQLKGLVAAIIPAKLSVGKVDFAVDMFDREDQNTLGPYWSGSAFSIRGKKAVSSSGAPPSSVTAAHVLANIGAPGNPGVSIAGYKATIEAFIGGVSGLADSVYLADLSDKNFSCEVLIDAVANDATQLNKSNSGIDDSGGFWEYSVSAFVGQLIPSGGGICIADSENKTEGFGVAVIDIPGGTASAFHGGGASHSGSVSLEPFVGALFRYGTSVSTPTNPLPQQSQDDAIDEGFYSNIKVSAYSVAATRGVAVVGRNAASVVCNDAYVVMSLNGVPVFTGSPKGVPTKSRSRAGIKAHPGDVTALSVTYPDKSLGGISSFKVWRSDIPKPPSETGHGFYEKGVFHYTDKYHTAIKDDGGKIIGYQYNPDA